MKSLFVIHNQIKKKVKIGANLKQSRLELSSQICERTTILQ